jgi:tRNA threonylcarbamoyl adenosine modification protein YeaZ
MIQKSTYLLAIETVGKVCGIAIIDTQNGNLQLEYVVHVPNMHDAMLAELIRRAMNDLHIQPEHIQAIAVSEGPGSFTGVRIGMSFAKGWCADGKTALISVPTFHAMFDAAKDFLNIESDSSLSIIIKSHADSYFMQTFDIATGDAKTAIAILSYEQAVSGLDESNVLIGDIHISDCNARRLQHISASHPTFIAKYGLKMLQEDNFVSPHDADPGYHAEFIPTIKGKKS